MTERLSLPTRLRLVIAVVIALQAAAITAAVLVGSGPDMPDWAVWVQGIGGMTGWAAPFLLKELIGHARRARGLGRGLSRPAWAALALFGVETAAIVVVAVMSVRAVFPALRAGH